MYAPKPFTRGPGFRRVNEEFEKRPHEILVGPYMRMNRTASGGIVMDVNVEMLLPRIPKLGGQIPTGQYQDQIVLYMVSQNQTGASFGKAHAPL